MKLSLLTLSLLFSMVAVASPYKLPQPRTLGPNKVPVFFISPAVQIAKATDKVVFLKSRAVLQWGVSRFESGSLIYKCSVQKNKCQVDQFQSHGTFEKCLVKNQKVRCYMPVADAATSDENAYPLQDRGHLDPIPNYEDPQDRDERGDSSSSVFEEEYRGVDDSHDEAPHFHEEPSDEGSSPLF